MGYPETHDYGNLVQAKTNAAFTPANLAATAAQWTGYYVAAAGCQVVRLYFFCTTTCSYSTTAAQIAVKRRPTYGSSSGAVTIATMTIPSGTAVGKVLYQDIVYGSKTSEGIAASSLLLNAGEELSLEVVTQATDSSAAAGAGFITFEMDAPTDNAANMSNMTAQNT